MPLLVSCAAWWIAGLLVGPSWAEAIGAVAACTVALAMACAVAWSASRPAAGARGHRAGATRAPVLLALSTIGAAGVLSGAHRARHDRLCREALASTAPTARREPLRVVLDAHAAPGRQLRGEVRGTGRLAGCRARATGRVTNGTADAGAIVTVAGTAMATSHGLRITGSVGRPIGHDRLRQWRGAAAARIDRLFGSDAPVVRALLVADRDDVPTDLRERFADAGLVHLLAISGLHVAIIAGALGTLCSAARLPRRIGAALAVAIITLYVAVIGAPAPAVRSAVMLATARLAEHWQRPLHPWTALALGAVLPTVDPTVVHTLGWQLSVSGVAALVASGALLRRFRLGAPTRFERRHPRVGDALRAARQLHGWRWGLIRDAAASTAATVVTAPLIAWHFGRLSVIGPLANLVAGPVVSLLQPALFLALLLAPLEPLARLVADGSRLLLGALAWTADTAAAVPWSVLHVAPGWLAATAAGVASAAAVRATAVRRAAPSLVVAAAALVVVIWSPFVAPPPGQLELHMLDVGQGDALALRTPRGRWILVDAGRRWDGGDAGRRTVVPYVRRRGGRVAMMIATHAHDDHVGGAATVVRALRPGQWWEPAFIGTSSGYREALDAVRRTRTPWRRVRPGDQLRLDGVALTVLGPDSAWTAAQEDANEASVVVLVQFGLVRILLTGDAEGGAEGWLVRRWGDTLAADVLKLGHHGSRTSSTPGFLDAVGPRLGLVSVGAGNRYRHPSAEVVAAFTDRGVPLLRTDEDGTVVLRTDGRRIDVDGRGGRWTLP